MNVDHASGNADRPTYNPPLEFSSAPSSIGFPVHRPDGRRRRQSHPLLTQQQQNNKLPIRSVINLIYLGSYSLIIYSLQQSKRTTDKKPALACLFCRGRKIACGPPVAGTKVKTCGYVISCYAWNSSSDTFRQCQRRSLTCVFPSESRRGMRKKNVSLNTEVANIPEASK